MNNTIDFNTAKTIDTMSKKIDHIDDTVSGFFSFMHMVMQNELGNAEPYFAAVSPVLDLTVIRPDDACPDRNDDRCSFLCSDQRLYCHVGRRGVYPSRFGGGAACNGPVHSFCAQRKC